MKKLMTLLSVLFVFNAYALESPHALEITHEMGTASFETTPKKVVALDWVLSETVLSLGVELEGIADAKGYQQWVVKPELNQGVTDVGSRREPNLELLTKLKPDVILISEHMAAAYHQLNKIAPVLVYSVYSQKKQPIESATAITLSLGKLFGQKQRAQQIIADTKQRLHDNGEKIQAAGNSDKPLIFARFINDKTLRIHSQGSLAQATIEAMGLKNDWQEPTNLWGFSTTGVVRLAEHQQANVMLFGPLTENKKNQLTQSALWQAMEFTRTDSVYELPSIWTFGGLIAAQRFSDHITKLLTQK
ncbi:iron-siderophore ABC transporter substrate-binding protein [Vibrio chagasii]|uniref:Iron-siderophore ABC transporter substrate-binding protein n=1 Tax=Vibrio chagasii TaxID=170679 RepID=A0A7V7THV9_9VIBR|nr:iron-siderophore ABC transporter substrate-binding protein [Vibrio chagasii]KAB0481489.1 iron-siderophore ABC transporter substrate-binding protein [Vibrio chagasii]